MQTLNLNVSDPQALYTDGSRELTGTIPLANSLVTTGGIFRAYIPWDSQESQLFVMNEDAEAFEFSDSGNVGLKLGVLTISENSLYHSDENIKIDWASHMLEGGWQIDQVLPYPEGILNLGYADARYLLKGSDLSAPLSFSSASTATSGLFRAYNEWNGEVENLLIYDADNELIKLGDLTTGLQIGNLKIEQYNIQQPGTGHAISFIEGLLHGSWGVFSNPDTEYGIVSKGYADSRYLRGDVQIDQPLIFAESLTATSGLFRAYYEPEDEDVEFFIINGGEERVELSDVCGTLKIGETVISSGGMYSSVSSARFNFEDKLFSGGWKVEDVPDNSGAIMSRGYADARYPLRSEGITTNHTFQAGDTLVISNGLITAINP